MHKSTEEAIDILKSVGAELDKASKKSSEEDPSGMDQKACSDNYEEKVEKALKSSAIVGMAKRARLHDFVAGVGRDQPTVGTNRLRGDYEPPVVPVRRVDQPFAQPPVAAPAMLKSCNQCGYVHKSAADCPRCERVHKMGGEALPLHFRGR